MAKSDSIELTGTVVEVLPGAKFKVKIDENNLIVTCTLNGKLRMNHITVILDDRVDIEISPYDLTKGRICWRHK